MNRKKITRCAYTILTGFGTIALSVLFFFLIYQFPAIKGLIGQILNILAPFLYGSVIAYLLRPLCNWYESFFQKHLHNQKTAENLAVTASFLSGLVLVGMLLLLILPQLLNSLLTLAQTLPGEMKNFVTWVSQYLKNSPDILAWMDQFYRSISLELETWIQSSLLPSLTSLMGSVGLMAMRTVNVLLDVIIGIVVAIYLLASRKKFARQSKMILYSVFKRSWADKILEEIMFTDKMFGGFVVGKLIDSLIIGLLCYFCMTPFNVNNTLLISVIIGVTNVVPFFGPCIGAIPATFLILIEQPTKAIWFVLFILVLQQFDGNILGPKILGDNTGLSSIWVLFSILLFGGLWGFVGMIIAVPLFAVIYDILRRLVARGLHRNHCDDFLVGFQRRPSMLAAAEPISTLASAEESAAPEENPASKDS